MSEHAAEQVIRQIRDSLSERTTVRDENAFLSNRFLYDNMDYSNVDVTGFTIDKGPTIDVSGKRNWKRREHISAYHNHFDSGYVKEIPWDTTLRFLENVYELNDERDDPYALTMLGTTAECISRQARKGNGEDIGEELEYLVEPIDFREMYLPDDLYRTQKKWTIALEDWKLCEHAYQYDTAVVTNDADIGRLREEIPRYNDVVVMTPETAEEYTDEQLQHSNL